jgi:flagellar assembly protein FliH
MGLVKGNASRPMLESAIVLDLGDLKRQGEEIIERARLEAERIIAEAKQEAQRLTAEGESVGREQGFRQGLEEGREKGETEAAAETTAAYEERLKAVEESWRNALDEWQSRREQLLSDASDDLLDLSLTIARRVVQREIEADRSVVRDQLRAVLEMTAAATAVTVVVHPDCRDFLEPLLPELIASLDRPLHASLRADDSFSPGGCIVRTEGGEIDARIETQLNRIVEALLPAGRRKGSATDAQSDAPSEDHAPSTVDEPSRSEPSGAAPTGPDGPDAPDDAS